MKKVKAESADSAFFHIFVKNISNNEQNLFLCRRCDGNVVVMY